MVFNKQYGALIAVLFFGVILTGCGTVPSKNVPVVRLMEILPGMLEEAEQSTREFWRDPQKAIRERQEDTRVGGFGIGTEQRVFYLKKGDEFRLRLAPLDEQTVPAPPESAVLVSNNDWTFDLRHRLSMTNDGDDGSAISFDGLIWHMVNGKKAPGDKPGEKPVIFNWVVYDVSEPNFLQGTPDGPVVAEAELQWGMYLNPEVTDQDAYWNWDSPQRPMSELRKGMIFNDGDKANITYPLTDLVVWFPQGTKARLVFEFIGNLVETEIQGDTTTFRILRDFYVYPKGERNISVSFDGEDWSNFFWSFKLKQLADSRATADNEVRYVFGMLLEYTGRK